MPQQRRPSFERMEATLLACPKCKRAVKVRKRLLLVLPNGDKYLYVCPDCGSTCGETIETPSPADANRSITGSRSHLKGLEYRESTVPRSILNIGCRGHPCPRTCEPTAGSHSSRVRSEPKPFPSGRGPDFSATACRACRRGRASRARGFRAPCRFAPATPSLPPLLEMRP